MNEHTVTPESWQAVYYEMPIPKWTFLRGWMTYLGTGIMGGALAGGVSGTIFPVLGNLYGGMVGTVAGLILGAFVGPFVSFAVRTPDPRQALFNGMAASAGIVGSAGLLLWLWAGALPLALGFGAPGLLSATLWGGAFTARDRFDAEVRKDIDAGKFGWRAKVWMVVVASLVPAAAFWLFMLVDTVVFGA